MPSQRGKCEGGRSCDRGGNKGMNERTKIKKPETELEPRKCGET